MKRTIFTALAVLTACSAIACGGSADFGAASPKAPQAYPQPAYAPAGVESSGGDGMAAQDATAPPAPPAGEMQPHHKAPSAKDPFDLDRPQNRPGLATSWGEARHSRVSSAPFVRANSTSPFAISTLFYNDPAGIAAMSDSHPGARHNTRSFAVGNGHLDFGIRDGGGHFLTGFETGGQNYVSAVAGRRYTIVVKNHSPGRVETVVSVDGLDVIDGKPGSLKKRGYLIDAFGDLEIEGFRTSSSEVAAFRFGSVSQSYASKKHGETRNVGVIGVAVFHEQGDNPNSWGNPQDASKRHNADPFPQQFAAPPDSY